MPQHASIAATTLNNPNSSNKRWNLSNINNNSKITYKILVHLISWIIIGSTLILLSNLLQNIGDNVTPTRKQTVKGIATDLIIRSQSLLERDTQLLVTRAAGRLDNILDPIFASYHQRVPEFAAWAFQWRTSYAFIRAGVFTTISLPFVESPGLQRYGKAWNELIAEKFDEIVLHPKGGTAALIDARNRWVKEVQVDIKTTITNTLLTAAMLKGQDIAFWNLQPMLINKQFAQATPSLATAISTATDPIKLHAIRPLLTRFTIRPVVSATVTVVGEALGSYGDLGFLGTATGMVATMAGFLSIDYLISRIDAAVSQQNLEIEIHRALDTEFEQLRKNWLLAMEAKINAHMINTSVTLQKILW
ncbi:hypothetical protein TI05_11770 [Achromatium sp. WMS3]|nr:hypothetical protein TI05_11770 [Achromatium sp. WMS3]